MSAHDPKSLVRTTLKLEREIQRLPEAVFGRAGWHFAAPAAFLPGSGLMKVGSGTPSVAGDSDTAATRPTSRAHFSVYDRQNACTHGWRGCGDVAEGSPRARGTPGSSKVRNSTGSQRQPHGGLDVLTPCVCGGTI